MDRVEKRKGTKPVPDNLLEYLNEVQLMTYQSIKSFGWDIKFIRRPLFQKPVCILTNLEKTMLAVIEEDGILKHPDIPLRGAENQNKEKVSLAGIKVF